MVSDLKEIVSDLKTWAFKGCKIAAQEKKLFLANFDLLAGFLSLVLLSASVERCFVSCMQDFYITIWPSGLNHE